MRNLIPQAKKSRGRVLTLLVASLVTVATTMALVVHAVDKPQSLLVTTSQANYQPVMVSAPLAPPLSLTVNSSGDAADVNIGDGICDADPAAGVQCTLRAALQESNTVAGADVIDFSLPSGTTISLSTALPTIVSDVTINGPADSRLTIMRSNAGGIADFRILTINGPAAVNLSRVKLTNGRLTNVSQTGGAISNGGTLTLNGVTISANTSTSNGAGIENHGTLNVYNSTISGNTSGGQGGGIINGGTATLNNSTISSNGAAFGGGIYNLAMLTMRNVTIAANTATSAGGGINNPDIALTNFGNTLIANNTAPTGPDGAGSNFNSLDFNLIGDTSSFTITGSTTHNIINVNARIGGLAPNESSVSTHSLLAGSPALDAGSIALLPADTLDLDGDSNTSEAIPFDQRGVGFNRVVDGPDADATATCDIGAFEAQVSIGDLADKSVNEDGSISFTFGVGGGANIDSVLAASSVTTLVPNLPANLQVTGSGASRTLTITPLANLSGTTNIAVAVSSTLESVLETFVLTVNPVVDTPSITNAATNEDTQTSSGLVITRNAVDGSEVSHFKITGLSNGTLFQNNGTTAIANNSFITFAQGNAGLKFTPAANSTANGSFSIQGATSASDAALSGPVVGATITVTAVNDPPVNHVPGSQNITQNSTLTFIGGNQISISDVDAGANSVRTTLTATNGTVSLATTTGLSFSAGDGTADAAMTFSGTVAAINTALNGLSFTPTNGFSGDALLQIVTNDQGNTGSGGALSDSDSILINVGTSSALIKFSSATFNTTESAGVTTITVQRTGLTSVPVTVEYETADHSESVGVFPCTTANGIASSRCDYTTALGKLTFAAGETSKTFQVLISQDAYVEGPEGVSLTLSNPTGGAQLAAPSTAMLIIADDATEPTTNPSDDPASFVRQHYHDFLNREPDAAGVNFWTQEITSCGSDQNCIEVKRINVSAAFFLSTEFQETGVLVFRAYKAAYGNLPGAPVPLRFNEYLPDAQQVGQGVQVGIGDWQAQLEANKTSYLTDFVTRSRFSNALPTSLTPAQFVDQLFLNTAITPSSAERQAAINEFGGAGTSADTSARVRAIRRVIENDAFKQAETNGAFVLMQYFGYMRRNPDVTPDANYGGYSFWLTKLNNFNGNFVNAEMVKAFIISTEYRARFGQP